MTTNRIWQLDAVRGLAVLGMVMYHFFFALYFFGVQPVPIFHWSWELFQTLVAGTFLVLVGISLRLRWQKLSATGQGSKTLFLQFLRRAAQIFSMGLLITLVTWLFLPEYYIRFGVLHLIGVSTLLALPFLSRPTLALGTGLGILLLPLAVPRLPPGNWLTFWIGFVPENFRSLDYFPLIPWFGLVLIGTVIGQKLRLPETRDVVPWLSWIGRHALVIYLLHQPVILGVVLLLERFS